MRKHIKSARDAALELQGRLNDLDGNSRALLAEQGRDIIEQLYHRTGCIVSALSQGLSDAHSFDPNKKRQIDTPRIILAAHIRHLMVKHLNVTATASKDGLFEEILKAVFADIPEGRRSNQSSSTGDLFVHDLALKR